MKLLDEKSKHEIIDHLEKRKLFFRTFWSVSDIFLTEDIPTACVQIINDRVFFKFNPTFWESGGLSFKLFLICHEQLHLMMNHFERLRFDQGDAENKNMAADIPINHLLIRRCGFDRERDIPEWQKYCWVETVFPDKPHIPDNQTVEFYYAQIKNQQEEGGGGCGVAMDDHEGTIEGIGGEGIPKVISDALRGAAKEFLDQVTEGMTDGEKQDTLEEISKDLERAVEHMAGSGFGGLEQVVNAKVKPKKNWKKLYKLIPKRLMSSRLKTHWISDDRRFALLQGDLMLPANVELSKAEKVIVHIYLDTSGSCRDDASYFLETALTLDPKYFKVEIFGFSDRVYDIPSKPPYKLKGFGGTSFQAISDHVDQQKRVDAVFVFTDGYACMANPNQPRKWFWFVLPNGTFNNIHPQCHSYDLSQYNWR